MLFNYHRRVIMILILIRTKFNIRHTSCHATAQGDRHQADYCESTESVPLGLLRKQTSYDRNSQEKMTTYTRYTVAGNAGDT